MFLTLDTSCFGVYATFVFIGFVIFYFRIWIGNVFEIRSFNFSQ